MILDKDFFKLPEELIITQLRRIREVECFSIVNRGKLWYNTITESQLKELEKWYKEWLDVTKTKKVPQKPKWLKGDI